MLTIKHKVLLFTLFFIIIEYISVTIISRIGMKSFPNCFFLLIINIFHFENDSCFMLEICQLLQTDEFVYHALFETAYESYYTLLDLWNMNCVVEWKYYRGVWLVIIFTFSTDHCAVFSSYSWKVLKVL